MQEAILADLLSVKTDEEQEKFIIARQLLKRGSSSFTTPCYIVHGDADKFVGVEQADEVADALKAIGAELEYERLEGLDHLFDVDDKVEMEKMYKFMQKHL